MPRGGGLTFITYLLSSELATTESNTQPHKRMANNLASVTPKPYEGTVYKKAALSSKSEGIGGI